MITKTGFGSTGTRLPSKQIHSHGYQTCRTYCCHWVGSREVVQAGLKALLQRKAKRATDLAYRCADDSP